MKALKVLKFVSLAICMLAMVSIFAVEKAYADRFFQTYSTWYEKIPENPQIMASSADYVNDMIINSNYLGISYGIWSPSIWYTDNTNPEKTVVLDTRARTSRHDYQEAQGWNIIRIPDGAEPGASNDGYMIVINTDTNELWDMARVRKDGENDWHADLTRKFDLSLDGVTPPLDGIPITTPVDLPYGKYDMHGAARVSSAPLLHGLITYDEVVTDGVIDHAIAFGYAWSCAAGHWGAYPTVIYTAGANTRSGCMKLGYRLQLDPTIDVTTLGLNAMGEIVAKALQDYGMIFVINTGAGSNNLYAEDLDNKPDSWSGVIGSLSGIPLSNFRVVEPLEPPFGDKTPPASPTGLTIQ